MTKPPVPSTALVLPVLAACTFVPGPFTDCDVTESHAAFVEAEGAELVRVEADAGSLRIEGDPGVSQVQVQGEACASSSEVLEAIRLTTVREDGTVFVRSEMPDRNDSWFPDGGQARLDLVLRVPERLALDVEDGSGSTEIQGVASVRLDDGSGSIDVRDVAGDVGIRDGSGSIDVSLVGGDFIVEDDGSGGIDFDDVAGVVRIPSGD